MTISDLRGILTVKLWGYEWIGWLVGDWFGITVDYPIAAAESRATKG